MSIVRDNLLKIKGYSPYCINCNTVERMKFNGKQFRCNKCWKETEFEEDFIKKVIEFNS